MVQPRYIEVHVLKNLTIIHTWISPTTKNSTGRRHTCKYSKQPMKAFSTEWWTAQLALPLIALVRPLHNLRRYRGSYRTKSTECTPRLNSNRLVPLLSGQHPSTTTNYIPSGLIYMMHCPVTVQCGRWFEESSAPKRSRKSWNSAVGAWLGSSNGANDHRLFLPPWLWYRRRGHEWRGNGWHQATTSLLQVRPRGTMVQLFTVHRHIKTRTTTKRRKHWGGGHARDRLWNCSTIHTPFSASKRAKRTPSVISMCLSRS